MSFIEALLIVTLINVVLPALAILGVLLYVYGTQLLKINRK